jgi:hypothetical protein
VIESYDKTGQTMRSVALAALAALIPTLCFADRKAGDACAKGLPPASRNIYASTVAAKVAPSEARSVVAAEAEKLVASGKMSIDQARTAAEAAGQCLELILK